MTNKKRATEISDEFIGGSLKYGCYLGAMKMAEWKDQQFKEYLENKLGNYAGGELVYAGVFINDIINELFKE